MQDGRPGTRSFRGSIRWRAALLTTALVALVLATFVAYVVRDVEQDLLQHGAERVETTAGLLANQTSQTSQAGLARFHDLAEESVFREFLLAPSEASKARAVNRLHAFTPAGQEEAIELWDAGRTRRLSVSSAQSSTIFPASRPPSALGIGPLDSLNGRLFTRVVDEIPRDSTGPGAHDRVGYLVLIRFSKPTTPTAVTGMIGPGAAIALGGPSGAWTNLERIIPPPAFDIADAGAREFAGADGRRLIGAAAPIAGTPWSLVIGLPRDTLVAPAWRLLGRLALAGLGFLVLTTMAAALLSARVTRPLNALTEAAQAIAQGDYSRRVRVNRRDEVGLLSRSFNLMAERVQQAHVDLQTRAVDLHKSREAARSANRVKDEFLATLSHELRTPLTAMLGWCHMLRNGIVPAQKAGHAIEVIERNAKAQLRLVEDLLDVSRMIAGKFTVELQPVDPAHVVLAAVESIQPIAVAKQVAIATHLAPGVGCVSGDPGRLQQAVWNLLANAIKFTPSDGHVSISVSPQGADIEIAVRDSGEGIKRESLSSVFDRLQQEETADRRPAGLGLGLAIVRQVVELHHGSVEAQSEGLGRGSTFRIRIPALPAETRVVPPLSGPPLAGTGTFPAVAAIAGIRVLAVEDADDSRELLRDFLANQQAIVVAVASGEAALEYLDRHRPDVIVSDIEMPGIGGLELIQRLRRRPSEQGGDIPAIALTAYGSAEDARRSVSSGFQAHLVKPVDLNELIATVAGLARVRDEAAVQ